MSEELKLQSKIVSLLLLCMQQHSSASNYILLAQSSLIGAVHMLSMRLLSLPSTDIWATPSAMAIDTLSCQLDIFLNGDFESIRITTDTWRQEASPHTFRQHYPSSNPAACHASGCPQRSHGTL